MITDMADISAIGQAEIPFLPRMRPPWEKGYMPGAMEILRERLEERRSTKGISPRALSLAIGANHSYFAQLINGKGGAPSADKLRALARELDTTTEYLMGESESPGPVLSQAAVADRLIDWRGPSPSEPGVPLIGTGDCAEFKAMGEHGEELMVERSSFDSDYEIRFLDRPPALKGSRDAYAIYFHGTSMEPACRAGAVGYVDPDRPARNGDLVVVQLNDGIHTDVTSVLVKELVQQNSRELILRQYNPPLTFIVPRTRMVRAHRIVMIEV